MLEKKLQALKNYLVEDGQATAEDLNHLTISDCYNDSYNTFEVIGNEYKVLTDDEADEQAGEEIKNSLWAFNPIKN